MNNITTFISRLQITMGIFCLIVFLVSTLIQVGSRHLGISVTWSEELAVNSFIWAMFLGAAVMVKEKEHFSFSGLTAKLEGKKTLAARYTAKHYYVGVLCTVFDLFN